MATQIQHRRGTTSGHATFTGASGEVTVDTDLDIAIVHDGSTAGGFPLVNTSSAQTLTNKTLTSAVLNTGVSGTGVKDEDTMSSDSATHLATQQSIKAYVDNKTAAQNQVSELTDTTISGASAGQVLVYDGVNSWDNQTTTVALTGAITGTANMDSSGDVSITTTATNDPSLTVTGDITGSATFTNLGNATLAATLASNSVDMGTHTTGSYVKKGATAGTGLSGAVDTESGTFTVTSNATAANTASAIVARDASGNFAAGTVTAALTGNVTGNVTGNTSGSAGSCTGNSATATQLASSRTIALSGDVSGSVSFDGSANATITAVVANDSHDHTDKAPLASPALTGTPTAPTAAADTNTTQVATTAYVQTELTALVGGAPGALDTLNELAEAINDDSSYASTITTSLATKTAKTSNQSLGSAANVMTISGNTITLARGDSTTDTVTVPDTNFTSADNTKLDGIATSATNVTNNNQLTNGAGYITGYTDTTYSAGAGLDISGTTFSIESDLRSDVFQIGRDTNDYYIINSTTHDWYLDGALDMRLANNGDLDVDGDVTAYSVTTTSDEKLKLGIRNVDNALEKVKQLNGIEFTWKKDGKKGAGVTAQDVEKVLPQAVKLNKNLKTQEEFKSVNYDALHALLIESIKELSAEIELLKKGA